MSGINQKNIVYIGDFDLRNENVQSHLVTNNGKIFNMLGYRVTYIGINRDIKSEKNIETLPEIVMGNNKYIELPNTLNITGVFEFNKVCKQIIGALEDVKKEGTIDFVITYQAPTYANIIKKIANWCKVNNAKYIVNSADLPVFCNQPIIKKYVMQINWHFLHKYNYKYADGIIAVSKYIEKFYRKKYRPSVVIPPLFDNTLLDNVNYTENYKTTFLYAGTPFNLLNHQVNVDGMKDRLDLIVDLFLELCEKGIDYKFVVIGITKDDYLRCIPRHKEALEKNIDIVFEGRLCHQDTLKELSKADFMINYRDENLMTKAGMSTKVVESVSVGTPVVMNDIGDTFNYLIKGTTGFMMSSNFNENIDLLTQLCLVSAEKRLAIKNKCKDAKTFAYESYVNRFQSFFGLLK